MRFNHCPKKQTQELCFSKKTKTDYFQNLTLNEANVESCSSQKHFSLILDEKLNFNEHIQFKVIKYNKVLGIIKRLSKILPCDGLLIIYKSFLDLIWITPTSYTINLINKSFSNKIENFQYKACLAVKRLSKVHYERSFIRISGLNLSVIDVGIENIGFSIK